jgi:hypothetical protein
MSLRPLSSRPAPHRSIRLARPAPHRSLRFVHCARPAQLVDRVFSKSFMTPTHLHGQARTDFEASLRKLIREADKEWVDQPVSGNYPPVNRIESSQVESTRRARRKLA